MNMMSRGLSSHLMGAEIRFDTGNCSREKVSRLGYLRTELDQKQILSAKK